MANNNQMVDMKWAVLEKGKLVETTVPSSGDSENQLRVWQHTKKPVFVYDINGHKFTARIDAVAKGAVLFYVKNDRVAEKKALVEFYDIAKFAQDDINGYIFVEVIIEMKSVVKEEETEERTTPDGQPEGFVHVDWADTKKGDIVFILKDGRTNGPHFVYSPSARTLVNGHTKKGFQHSNENLVKFNR